MIHWSEYRPGNSGAWVANFSGLEPQVRGVEYARNPGGVIVWSKYIGLLRNLSSQHIDALRWFDAHSGGIVAWPDPLPDGTLLVTQAKGIYKPKGDKYALSIRQTLDGPYPDGEVETLENGNWRYKYFQEDLDPEERDQSYTNRGLIECWKDVVPIGVMIQRSKKPTRYLVLGLALVTGWDSGYFIVEGTSKAIEIGASGVSERPSVSYLADSISSTFDPHTVSDQRIESLRRVKARQGQQGFRATLLTAYAGRCAITGYDANGGLEAAHIVPYRGPVTNHPSNGLLLRADLHNLFDLGLIAINEESHEVLIASEIRDSEYGRELRNADLRLPAEASFRPSAIALELHRRWAKI